MNTLDISHAEEIYTVSRLAQVARILLEQQFPLIWLEGEISNFSAPQSGHWYFSLKDSQAQIRCAMFRLNNRRLGFIPVNGMQALVRARVTLYEGRGDFQLVIDHIEQAGEGILRKAFEALKQQLAALGLFDLIHKKKLPPYPKAIGVITSSTGAAIQDILMILKRRAAHIPIIIYPTLVQGSQAADEIVAAIELANQRNECNVLIIARGGGSLEDLWPFNEAHVAHAVFNSKIPIISGIGHEIDFTIVDFVADQRAPTPSAAAELVSIDRQTLLQLLLHSQRQLLEKLQQKMSTSTQQLMWMHKHLQQYHPKRQLFEQQTTLDQLTEKLNRSMQHYLAHAQQTVAMYAHALDTLNPLATLQRGYAIASRKSDGAILYKSSDIKAGEALQVQLAEGMVECIVKKM